MIKRINGRGYIYRKGFTLIEILVVVAIISILASVVLVGLGPTRKIGRDARRISDLPERMMDQKRMSFAELERNNGPAIVFYRLVDVGIKLVAATPAFANNVNNIFNYQLERLITERAQEALNRHW